MVTKSSPSSVAETVASLERELEARGVKLFAVIDAITDAATAAS